MTGSNNDISRYFQPKTKVDASTRTTKKPNPEPQENAKRNEGATHTTNELWTSNEQLGNNPSKCKTIEKDLEDSNDDDHDVEAIHNHQSKRKRPEMRGQATVALPPMSPENVFLQSNPFAKFAASSSASNVVEEQSFSKVRSEWRVFQSNLDSKSANIARATKMAKRNTNHNSNGTSMKQNGFVSMKNLTQEEQARITKKWHSLADATAPLEVRRYQVLLAARLHARCQEPSVRNAMTQLRAAMPQGLTVETVAQADPEVLASCISNLQFYNVKAQQVVKAAQEIQCRFHGKVPEEESFLVQLTGIGKCFADLLAFVNTREKHMKAADEPVTESC